MMKNRRKQCSVMLLGLTILMIIPLIACEPEWCDDKWTEFANFEYGYTVKYPTSCSLMYSDYTYSHELSIFFTDGWSELTIAVYKLDYYSLESLFNTFKDDILAATEEDYAGDLFFKRYDYEILQLWEDDESDRQIDYTFTAARADIESGGWDKTDMLGETWWFTGTYHRTEYIYSCTYETLADCDKCVWVCEELTSDLFSNIQDNLD